MRSYDPASTAPSGRPFFDHLRSEVGFSSFNKFRRSMLGGG